MPPVLVARAVKPAVSAVVPTFLGRVSGAGGTDHRLSWSVTLCQVTKRWQTTKTDRLSCIMRRYSTRTKCEAPTASSAPIAAPASTSLKKCMPSRIREAATLTAQNSSPIARSG